MSKPMELFLDVETSGLDRLKHNILSLGAVTYADLEHGGSEFYGECRLNDGEECSEKALEINGFTRESIFDERKLTRVQLYNVFMEWLKEIGTPVVHHGERKILLIGENIVFDALMLRKAYDGTINFGNDWPFGYRFVDIHSIRYWESGESQGLNEDLAWLGLKPEPTPHTALDGARQARAVYKALENV